MFFMTGREEYTAHDIEMHLKSKDYESGWSMLGLSAAAPTAWLWYRWSSCTAWRRIIFICASPVQGTMVCSVPCTSYLNLEDRGFKMSPQNRGLTKILSRNRCGRWLIEARSYSQWQYPRREPKTYRFGRISIPVTDSLIARWVLQGSRWNIDR
jgi:hypothetical protein